MGNRRDWGKAKINPAGTEPAFQPPRGQSPNKFQPAKAANGGRSLSSEEKAAIATKYGVPLKDRAGANDNGSNQDDGGWNDSVWDEDEAACAEFFKGFAPAYEQKAPPYCKLKRETCPLDHVVWHEQAPHEVHRYRVTCSFCYGHEKNIQWGSIAEAPSVPQTVMRPHKPATDVRAPNKTRP